MSAPVQRAGLAIGLMVTAIFCFSLMDLCVRFLAPRTGVLPALWARYAGQMLVVTLLVAPRLAQVARTHRPGTQLLRSLALMATTGLFFWGLTRLKLADNAALMSVNPVLITLGAALFLGERLGPRRVIGILVAMGGALMIIRPGSDVFSPYAVLPLAAAVTYTAYALLTRKVGRDEDVWTSLFYTGLVGTVVMSAVVPVAWVTPDLPALAFMAGIAGFGTVGQLALIRAFSLGEAAMLAPFAYVGLIFAGFWGFAFFHEVPDGWTLAGALVIAGAGLYVWHRENQSR